MVGSHRVLLPIVGGLLLLLLAAPAQARQVSSTPSTRPGSDPYYGRGPTLTTRPADDGKAGSRPGQGPAYPPGYGPSYIGSVNVQGPTLTTAPQAPSYASGAPYAPPPYYGGGYGYPGYGIGTIGSGPGVGYGQAMQGMASLTSATGQYWNDIQQARITREQSRQAHVDTQRKQMEWEMEYEKLRPTAPKMRDAQRATDLDWARKDPPSTEIWSGRTLNTLLKSVFSSPAPTRGPNIPLEPEMVKGLNLTDKTTRANLSLAKDDGKIDWTEALQEAPFDAVRDRFSKNFDSAIKGTSSGETPPIAVQRDLRSDLKSMEEMLDDRVRDLPPSRYIEARRLLNQLNDTVKGLSNSRLVKSANQGWKKDVRTVGQLVNHCLKNGLEFGPAVTPADYPAYTAAYYAIRAYERGVVGTATVSTSN